MPQANLSRPLELAGYNAVTGSPIYSPRCCQATLMQVDKPGGGHHWQALPASKPAQKRKKKKNDLAHECNVLYEKIVESGYFPASPEPPWTAFSLDVLEQFLTMNVRSTLGGSAFQQGLAYGLQLHSYEITAEDPWKHQLSEALT
ncbi:hypothetical protein M422DRAFT_259305 [Sphaerobolus stellatus SS14]|uniref:Uncharacterized protein n=1 Tax=Sphaerobolus stellatus (strain SS14) TaxID=990650 RepID=A0A0C9VKU2_SPHS4|nr:hypothetical protein M422DRAFT_259305 [Sphaerobolus stellatus SS14]